MNIEEITKRLLVSNSSSVFGETKNYAFKYECERVIRDTDNLKLKINIWNGHQNKTCWYSLGINAINDSLVRDINVVARLADAMAVNQEHIVDDKWLRRYYK